MRSEKRKWGVGRSREKASQKQACSGRLGREHAPVLGWKQVQRLREQEGKMERPRKAGISF